MCRQAGTVREAAHNRTCSRCRHLSRGYYGCAEASGIIIFKLRVPPTKAPGNPAGLRMQPHLACVLSLRILANDRKDSLACRR
jgi:hypothetical protein